MLASGEARNFGPPSAKCSRKFDGDHAIKCPGAFDFISWKSIIDDCGVICQHLWESDDGIVHQIEQKGAKRTDALFALSRKDCARLTRVSPKESGFWRFLTMCTSQPILRV